MARTALREWENGETEWKTEWKLDRGKNGPQMDFRETGFSTPAAAH